MVGRALIADWSQQLDFIFKQDYYQQLLKFLEYESTHNKTIYPPKDQIFNAFNLSSFKNTKVIIFEVIDKMSSSSNKANIPLRCHFLSRYLI